MLLWRDGLDRDSSVSGAEDPGTIGFLPCSLPSGARGLGAALAAAATFVLSSPGGEDRRPSLGVAHEEIAPLSRGQGDC